MLHLPHFNFGLPPHLERRISHLDCGCWVYRGELNRNGYGWFRSADGRKVMVHRFVFSLLRGSIPEGFILDHVKDHCNLRNCCNPWHLEPVTHSINTRRSRAVLFTKKPT
jgi:hypothetical protein